MKRSCVWWLSVFLSITTCTAQEEQSFSAQTNLVRVPTLVRDASGKVVLGLRADDFVIEDDDVAQTPRLEAPGDSQPVSLMIAVQIGRGAKNEFGRIAGLSSMLDPVLSDRENEAAVLFFDSKLNLVRDFESNPDQIEMDLQKLPSGDRGAAILDAIAYSARLL